MRSGSLPGGLPVKGDSRVGGAAGNLPGQAYRHIGELKIGVKAALEERKWMC